MPDPKEVIKDVPKKRPDPAKMNPEILARYQEHLRRVAASKKGGK